MAQGNNSIKKVLIVAFALCIVCSVIVSTAAVALRPMQQLNQELDRKTNILNVAKLYEPGMDVEEVFNEEITARVVDLDTGEYSKSLIPILMTVLRLRVTQPRVVHYRVIRTLRDCHGLKTMPQCI